MATKGKPRTKKTVVDEESSNTTTGGSAQGSRNRKPRNKKTVADEESSNPATGGSAQGSRNRKPRHRKTVADEDGEGTKLKKKEDKKKRETPTHLEMANRKKNKTSVEDKLTKSVITNPTTCVAPVIEPQDDVIDPEKDMRLIDGRDPENMTENQMKNLRAIVEQFETMGVKGLMDEFESIKSYNIQPFKIEGHESNPAKNRYKDICCIDKTRIKLNVKGKKGGDYIHANYVKLPPILNTFVTTQGPIEGTVIDFWRLVVQEKVGYIFMLCSLVELGKKKCEQYYPTEVGVGMRFGDVNVKLVSTHDDNHFVNSKFELSVKGQAKRRYLYHHYWKDWPDHSVPITAMAGLRLLRHARLTNYATLVHCSAGVGRTGTLVAIEWMLQKICSSPPPYDMKEMLREMRNQRAHAIQTAPQYVYIAFVIYRLLATKDTALTKGYCKFAQDIQTHTGVKIDGGGSGQTKTGPAKTAVLTPKT